MNNLRTDVIDRSLERTLSRKRLEKYLAATSNDLSAAISLYERNTRLSEALYTTLQGLEICLRNTIKLKMSDKYGQEWLTNGSPPLQQNERDAIQEIRGAEIDPTHDDLVAELKFSFWVGLLGTRYDNTLWRTSLFGGFSATGGKRRSEVHGRMNALRRFRNRVAHHEPIFPKASQMHNEALEAISWMCRDTHAWVAACSRFTAEHDS